VVVAGTLAELLGYDAHFTPSGSQRQPVQSQPCATGYDSPFGPIPRPSCVAHLSTNQSLRSVTLIAAPVAESIPWRVTLGRTGGRLWQGGVMPPPSVPNTGTAHPNRAAGSSSPSPHTGRGHGHAQRPARTQ